MIEKEDYEFLLGLSWWVINYGTLNHEYEDYLKMREIEKKYAEKESKS